MDTLDRVFAACYPSELARRLHVSPQALHEWRRRGLVPVGRVLDVETITGIPRHELRPDIYPSPQRDDAAP